MNDPHVESLTYEAGAAAENINYGDPKPLDFTNTIGDFRLADGVLTVAMAEHFSDLESARHVVDQYLRSWEVQTDLLSNPGQLKFTYKTANIIDRNPPPPGTSQVISIQGSSTIAVTCSATINLSIGQYPEPPTEFTTTSDVELFHARWLQYRDDKQPLQTMSYFMLHALEKVPGGRKAVAKKLSISRKVFNKISILSSYKGNAMTARKSTYVEMTGAEKAWLERAVKAVILRVGEHASGATVRKLTMSDLPKLP